MNKGFRSLADRIVDSLFEALPFFATANGIHHYDHLVDRYDAEARASHLREAARAWRAFLLEGEESPWATLAQRHLEEVEAAMDARGRRRGPRR